MRDKSFVLVAGYEEGWNWFLRMRVYSNEAFHIKGKFYFDKYSGKARVRILDRLYFVYHLGKDYMKGKEVHHEWNNNAITRVLSKAAHKEAHGVAR